MYHVNYLCQDLSKYNQKGHSFRFVIDTLMENLSNIENTLSLTNTKVTNLSITNIDLHSKEDRIEMYVDELQRIMNNWAHSHHKLSK